MKLEYAILDIETTGGNARGSRMTDVDDVRDNMTRYTGNHCMAQLIINYAE